jgi:hypothetical protein
MAHDRRAVTLPDDRQRDGRNNREPDG